MRSTDSRELIFPLSSLVRCPGFLPLRMSKGIGDKTIPTCISSFMARRKNIPTSISILEAKHVDGEKA